MSRRLLAQTLRWQRGSAGGAWSSPASPGALLIPVIYAAFSDVFRDMANSGVIPEELMNFGSGSLFTLPGAVTLGLPASAGASRMIAIFAVGASAMAVAGERARGTLEVLLARPISRLTLYVSILVALLVAVIARAGRDPGRHGRRLGDPGHHRRDRPGSDAAGRR